MFLRVGVTKYCKLQGKMLGGSVTVSAEASRPLYQHRENPSVQALFGESKVLRIGLPIVENLSRPQESTFSLFKSSQLHFGENSTKMSNDIQFMDFPLFPVFGVP